MTIPGHSVTDILHELLVAPRKAIIGLPDTQVIDRPGWFQLITPSLTRGGLNEIMCTTLPDDRVDAILDESIAVYRALGLRFRWTITPDTHPPDLAERLERRGLVRSEALAMARLTDGTRASAAIEPITLANVDDFTHVMAEGWQMDPAPLDALHRRMLAEPPRRQHLFLARVDGVPAGAGSYTALERSAYLVGAVVLPAHRGRGLYRALVDARLAHAAGQGLPLATSLARAETSAPILTRMGFHTACRIPVLSFEG